MRSKRVTKLMACILASSMCTMPVFASGQGVLEHTFTGDVTVESVALNVTVPTSFSVKVNPFYGNVADTVSGSRIASDEFVISNNTSKNNAPVAVMCTTTAQITKKGDDVKLYYSDITPDDNSKVKKVHMDVKTISQGVTASNNQFIAANGVRSIAVTNSKTQIDMKVAGNGGYGAFAIMGNANVGAADWKAGDLATSVAYRIRAVGAGTAEAPITALPTVNVQSANLTTAGIDVAGSTLTANVVKDATIFGVQFHSPDNLFEDVTMQATETQKVTITKTQDTTTPEYASWTVKLPGTSPFVANLSAHYADYKGRDIDVIVFADNGDRYIGKLHMQ